MAVAGGRGEECPVSGSFRNRRSIGFKAWAELQEKRGAVPISQSDSDLINADITQFSFFSIRALHMRLRIERSRSHMPGVHSHLDEEEKTRHL